jgi:hypothetical protein
MPMTAVAVPPALELALHTVELGRGSVETPAVADEPEEGKHRNPDWPERAVGTGGSPDQRAENKQAQSASRLLEEPPLKLPPVLYELSTAFLGRHRQLREVGQERLQVWLRPGRVDRLKALVELVLAESSGGEMVAQLAGGIVALLVGGSDAAWIGHGGMVRLLQFTEGGA